jgi:hypothetical protein
VNKLVVAFDICSSTTILERLKQVDSLGVWRNFLINLKDIVLGEGDRYTVEVYNFTGDGWILLFPRDTPTNSAGSFLQRISASFHALFQQSITPLIGTQIKPVGLTFGIDAGELVGLTMVEKNEYLGRPINIACRLQACAKNLEGGPEYKALFSMNSFNRPMLPEPTLTVKRVMVSLRNVNPPTTECLLFETYRIPEVAPRRPRINLAPRSKYRSGL